jgi:hypothetical protein
MSQISVLFRMSDQNFLIVPSDLSPYYCDVLAGIVKEQERQAMDRVRFGYRLSQMGSTVSTGEWPSPGVQYVETDQEVIESARVLWSPASDTQLEVWLEFSGWRFDGVHHFSTPPIPEPPETIETEEP